MIKPSSSLEIDLRLLRTLIRKGRLFDMQRWLEENKSALIPETDKQTLFGLTVETGFHSMVEVLAKAWSDRQVIDHTFCLAVWKRRVDLAWLLLECGADMWAVDLQSVAQCYDVEFMRYYFERWHEGNPKHGLYEVVTARVQRLIGLIREYAPRLPNHEAELAQALKYYINDKDQKWVSLSLWLGANPRLRVPDPHWRPDEENVDPEDMSTPMEDAVFRGQVKILKTLKPSKDLDNLNLLICKFWLWDDHEIEVVEYLIGRGGSINNLPSGGSTILGELLCQRSWSSSFGLVSAFTFFDIRRVDEWVQRGARFVPDGKYELRRVRECLCGLNQDEANRLLKVLARATEPEVIKKLVSTPKITNHLGMTAMEIMNMLKLARPAVARRKK